VFSWHLKSPYPFIEIVSYVSIQINILIGNILAQLFAMVLPWLQVPHGSYKAVLGILNETNVGENNSKKKKAILGS